MRHVLVLTYDFPPRGATAVFRITKFVRYLPEFGWQPVVVAADVRGGMRDEGLLAQLPPDLDVIRVPNPFAPTGDATHTHAAQPSRQARLRSQLKRLFVPDAQMLWVPAAVRAATRRLRQGDIAAIMTTAPPYSVHMAGLWLKHQFPSLPWLIDLRDIWSENPAITNPTIFKLQRACERACIEHADQITTATDGQRHLLQRTFGVPEQRIATITNGFDPSDLPSIDPSVPHAALRVTHVGSIIGNRAVAAHGLFAALGELAAQGVTGDQLQVRLVGVFDPQIYMWAEPLLASGVIQLHPFVPYAESFAHMAEADVLLLLTADDREGRLSHPNKLFEYFAIGKPVLALTPEGDVARLVREAQAGRAIVPSAASEVAAALADLIEAYRTGKLHTPQARDLARFERRNLTRQLAQHLDRLVAR